MTASNVSWAGETADASDGAGSFSKVTLSPKRLTAYIDISKQLLNQDSAGVEAMIRQDIVNAINSKLEDTILGSEDGAVSGGPDGMFFGKTPTEGVTTMAKVAEVEATVENANVIGDCKWVVSPSFKAALRSAAKGANVSESLYANGEIDGTQALSTGHVAKRVGDDAVDKAYAIYGDFSNLAIGQWGAIDLTVDNYTQATKGCVRLVINAYFDAKVLRSAAFAYATTYSA
jgi:HK97 family phage major capsid protein